MTAPAHPRVSERSGAHLYNEAVKTKRRSPAARSRLAEAYDQYLAAKGSKKKNAGKELIEAIFGRGAIAEDRRRR
jgi:hypothetical protein